jgi:hypothetical protein
MFLFGTSRIVTRASACSPLSIVTASSSDFSAFQTRLSERGPSEYGQPPQDFAAKDIFRRAGFEEVTVFGDLDGNEYGVNASRLIEIGRKSHSQSGNSFAYTDR